jgi:hypothetical protein
MTSTEAATASFISVLLVGSATLALLASTMSRIRSLVGMTRSLLHPLRLGQMVDHEQDFPFWEWVAPQSDLDKCIGR